MSNVDKTEVWRQIPGFEDYEVSNLGKVMSFRTPKPKLLSIQFVRGTSRRPIPRVGIRPVGSSIAIKMTVARLMMYAFLGVRDGKEWDVVHMDGDSSNNIIGNLTYLRKDGKRESYTFPKGKKLNIDLVRKIRNDNKNGLSINQLCDKFNVCRSHMRNILKGKSWCLS